MITFISLVSFLGPKVLKYFMDDTILAFDLKKKMVFTKNVDSKYGNGNGKVMVISK